MPRVVAILPARDEAPRVGAVVRRLAATVPGIEVIVVDDGSRDDTAGEARRAGAEVLAGPARGYPAAVRAGWRAALERGAGRAVLLDADGQHPPEAVPRLLAALDAGADLAVASRAGTRSPAPLARRAGNALLALAVRLAAGGRLRDVTSGFQAAGPRAIELLARALPDEAADANVRVLALRAGLRVVEVPVEVAPRPGGRSMHDGARGLVHLARSVRAVVRAAR